MHRRRRAFRPRNRDVVRIEWHSIKVGKRMSFYIKTVLLAALCVVVGHVLPFFSDMAGEWVWYATVSGYALLTILLRMWVVKVQNSSPIKFTTAINGTTAIKMLLTLAIITSYLAAKLPFPRQYVFGVFVVFITFTALFVIDSQRLVRGR